VIKNTNPVYFTTTSSGFVTGESTCSDDGSVAISIASWKDRTLEETKIDEDKEADRIADVIIRLHYQNLLTTKPHLRPLLKSWLIYFGKTLTPVGVSRDVIENLCPDNFTIKKF